MVVLIIFKNAAVKPGLFFFLVFNVNLLFLFMCACVCLSVCMRVHLRSLCEPCMCRYSLRPEDILSSKTIVTGGYKPSDVVAMN